MTADDFSKTWERSFYNFFPSEKHVIDEKNSITIGTIIARAAANGSLRSGGIMSQIASELADSLQERALMSVRIIQKIVAAYDQTISGETKSEIVDLLQKLIRDQQEQLRSKALSTPPFKTGPEETRDAALGYIDLKANLAIEYITGEITLMAAKKPAKLPLDQTAYQIIALLKEDFISSGRTSADLTSGYEGPSLLAVQEAIVSDGETSQVDFDLSLGALEKNGLIQTGPTALYDNPPGSSVMVIAVISKREYVYLTEAGYRTASKPQAKPSGADRGPSITIRDSHFHHSPVGAGTTVTQTVSFDVSNENETVNYLFELLSQNNSNVDISAKQEIKNMLDAASGGDVNKAKTILQKLFGGTTSAVKELATGVLTAIVTKQLGF